MLESQVKLSGSYDPSDVIFLLKEVDLAPVDLASKEALIQSGQKHYSEMISEERRPDKRYMDLFEQACVSGRGRMACEIVSLAAHIKSRIAAGTLDAQITLCSLVRAGIPYGVLLQRALSALNVDSAHYGVSIIRDRGLDKNAMRAVMKQRPVEGIIFVDGWTGKGAIARELTKSWGEISGRAPEFLVLADPSGYATMSGSHDDWLIPSGILGANASGLISRSILNDDLIGPDDFHGTLRVTSLTDIDVSRKFVDDISKLFPALFSGLLSGLFSITGIDPVKTAKLRLASAACINKIASVYNVDHINRIKPGISEATRAVLRRTPKMVFLRSSDDPDLSALVHLCAQDAIETKVAPDLTGPYRAITLIEKVA